MIARSVRQQLPKANLISIHRTYAPMRRWYVGKFRLANAVQLTAGPVSVILRAPWLERPARQLYPHLFHGETAP